MVRPRLTAFMAMALAAIAISTPAQSAPMPRTVTAETQKSLEQDRKRLISANLELTPEEARKFWPLYDRFAAELTAWRDRRRQRLGLFGENYDNLSDAEARQFVEDGLAMEEQRQGMLRRHLKSVGEVLPPYKLALYSQIEFKIHAFVEAGIAEHIPLLDETAPPADHP
jgi:hypothetical protein